ncbi:MAG: hypothetical protein IJM50_00145 [Lachnospiraceae bacterium]|nr:hypothetical protein [Lachnospiraceae bacterium]
MFDSASSIKKFMNRRVLLSALLSYCFLLFITGCSANNSPDPGSSSHTHSHTSSIIKEATCIEAGICEYVCSCGDTFQTEIPKLEHQYEIDVEDTGDAVYICSYCGQKLAVSLQLETIDAFLNRVRKDAPEQYDVFQMSSPEKKTLSDDGLLYTRNYKNKNYSATALLVVSDLKDRVREVILMIAGDPEVLATEDNLLAFSYTFCKIASCMKNGQNGVIPRDDLMKLISSQELKPLDIENVSGGYMEFRDSGFYFRGDVSAVSSSVGSLVYWMKNDMDHTALFKQGIWQEIEPPSIPKPSVPVSESEMAVPESTKDGAAASQEEPSLEPVETIRPSESDYAPTDPLEPSATIPSSPSKETAAPVHEHSFVSHPGKEPTCTSSGWAEYNTCSCGYTDYQELPALGHQYSVTEHRDAGCEENGFTSYQCTRCGDVYSEEHLATGHELTEASCAAPSVCNKCGKVFGSALPHTMLYGICGNCGHRDFSEYACSLGTILEADSWYHPEGGNDRFLQNGEASISIDRNGSCTVHFDTFSYSFDLGQGFISSLGNLTFYCYSGGTRLGTEYGGFTRIVFRQVRGENVLEFDGGGAWGFSQISILFKRN